MPRTWIEERHWTIQGGIATYVADLNANTTPVSHVVAFSGTVETGNNGDPDQDRS